MENISDEQRIIHNYKKQGKDIKMINIPEILYKKIFEFFKMGI